MKAAGREQPPENMDGPGTISGHFRREVDALLECGVEPRVVWQRLHLKYKIKMDGATPAEIEKFLAIPGHQSLRNRAKTLRVKARKEHGEGEGAKDLVNRDESGGSKASSEMTVRTRAMCS